MFESLSELLDKYARLPNNVLDVVNDKDLSDSAYRIFMKIVRQTYGWRTIFDEISISQFMDTGLSRGTIINAVKELVTRRYILSVNARDHQNQKRKLYFINTTESQAIVKMFANGEVTYRALKQYRKQIIESQKGVVQNLNHGSSEFEPGVVQNLNHGGSEFELTKEHSIKNTFLKNSNKKDLLQNSEAPGPEKKDAAAFLKKDEPDQNQNTHPVEPLLNDKDTNNVSQPELPLQATSEQPGQLDDKASEHLVSQIEIQKLAAELQGAGVSPWALCKELAAAHPARCRQQLDWLPKRFNLKEPGAFLHKAIAQNYGPPPGVKLEQAQAQTEDEKAQKASIIAAVIEKAETHKLMRNRHGHRLQIMSVDKQNGYLNCRNLDMKGIFVNVPPEQSIRNDWDQDQSALKDPGVDTGLTPS